jgi:tight adherence protein B
MDTLFVLLFLVLFAVVALAAGAGFKYIETQRTKKVAGMLKTVSGEATFADTSVLRSEVNPDPGILSHLRFYHHTEMYLRQSGLDWTMGRLFLTMAILGAIGALLGTKLPVLVFTSLSIIALGVFFALLPYVYVRIKRKKRLAEFEAQFPEGLDFLARSMRAGHAFSVSLGMLADEFPDPMGMEFRIAHNEQNLGAPVEVALQSMITRMPLLDLRFFVSSVLLQKETGGNLGEILSKLSYVIRERFRLKGQVKAASAHGRITATVLICMPIALMLALMAIAPGYLSGMARDEHGKYLILGSICGQFLGIYFIRRIINIKV